MQGKPRLYSLDPHHVNPLLLKRKSTNETSKPDGEAAINEEVTNRFRNSLATWTNVTILPPSLHQAAGRPKPILNCKPCKKLDINHIGQRRPKKLRFIGGCHGVLAASYELILHPLVLIQLGIPTNLL